MCSRWNWNRDCDCLGAPNLQDGRVLYLKQTWLALFNDSLEMHEIDLLNRNSVGVAILRGDERECDRERGRRRARLEDGKITGRRVWR